MIRSGFPALALALLIPTVGNIMLNLILNRQN
jgi:hypothetical protein